MSVSDYTRVCRDCGLEKPLSEYTIIRDKQRGTHRYYNFCKPCRSAKGAARKKERRAKDPEFRKRVNQINRDSSIRTGRTKGPAKRVALDQHMDRIAPANARQAWKYWLKVKAPDCWLDSYYKQLGLWFDHRLSAAEKYKVRYRYDIEYNLHERLRRQRNKHERRDQVAEMIRGAIRRDGESPTISSLFGYSIAELKEHLERQFINGMDWDRFMAGEIHIDHIIPQKQFKLSDDEDYRRCWCLSNLRPMWARDNLRKGARVETLL